MDNLGPDELPTNFDSSKHIEWMEKNKIERKGNKKMIITSTPSTLSDINEIKKIEDYFRNISTEDFEKVLERNGISEIEKYNNQFQPLEESNKDTSEYDKYFGGGDFIDCVDMNDYKSEYKYNGKCLYLTGTTTNAYGFNDDKENLNNDIKMYHYVNHDGKFKTQDHKYFESDDLRKTFILNKDNELVVATEIEKCKNDLCYFAKHYIQVVPGEIPDVTKTIDLDNISENYKPVPIPILKRIPGKFSDIPLPKEDGEENEI